MIKVALKHFIYETCINTVFEQFYKNFVKPIPDKKVPKYMWEVYWVVKEGRPRNPQVIKPLNQFKAVADAYEMDYSIFSYPHKLEDLEYFYRKLEKFLFE